MRRIKSTAPTLVFLSLVGGSPALPNPNVEMEAYLAMPPAMHSDVLRGVSLHVYRQAEGLEYDWIVAPGIAPETIRMHFGSDSVVIDGSGELTIRRLGLVSRHSAPRAYQMVRGRRVPISSRFMLTENGSVGFTVGPYDRSLELVIDPVVRSSVSIGGSTAKDEIAAVAVDAEGFTYVTGTARSRDFPTTEGVFQRELRAPSNLFVAKIDKDGKQLIWSTYLGGTGRFSYDPFGEIASAIAVDSAGNVYVAGVSMSNSDYPALPPGGSFPRLVITKLSADGKQVLFSAGFEAGDQSRIKRMIVDGADNLYFAGWGGLMPVTKGAFQTDFRGTDGFIGKLDSLGRILYATYLGGSNRDEVHDMAIDAEGNAFVAGYTQSVDFPVTSGAFQTDFKTADCGGGFLCNHGFVAKLNASGTALAYATYLGGSYYDYAYGIGVDSSGNAFVTGNTSSVDFPVTSDALRISYGPAPSAFLSKLDTTGSSLLYSTYFGGGGGGSEISRFVGMTPARVYIAGHSWGNTERNSIPQVNPIQAGRGERLSDTNPNVGGCVVSINMAGPPFCSDGFVAVFDSAKMELVFSTYLGGRGYDNVEGLVVDAQGDAIVVGNSPAFGVSRAWPIPGSKAQTNFITRIGMEGAAPLIRRDWIRDSVTFAPTALVGGLRITLFGQNITAHEGTISATAPLPTELDGISVEIGRELAPIFSVSRVDGTEHVSIVLPWELGVTVPMIFPDSIHIAVNNNGSKGLPIFAQLLDPAVSNPVSPIFLLQSTGDVMAVHSGDGTPVTRENPACRGESIALYAIGLGPVDLPLRAGEAAPENPPARIVYPVQVSFGGVKGEVLFSGLKPGTVGLYEVQVRVPSDAPIGATIVQLLFDGTVSQAKTIQIQ